ncbi:hypothetical protein B0H10DRAFT_1952384 [Mycena sp. CBHHK59/15]|nr:hypothetical protein B0H10DRAFT_1952384 [Mycena sp. CBHHK59/15]
MKLRLDGECDFETDSGVELGMDIEQGMGIEMQGGRTHMMGGTCRGFDLELRSGLETQRGVECEEWDVDDPAGDPGALSKHGMMWGCETSMEVLGCAASGVGTVMTKNGWRMRC